MLAKVSNQRIVCPGGLQPSTRRVIEEWMAGITDVGGSFVALFHAVFPRRRAVLSDRKLSHVSRTRCKKEAVSFTDRNSSLHLMNREDWSRYRQTSSHHVTITLLASFKPNVDDFALLLSHLVGPNKYFASRHKVSQHGL
jgi:hypothetical protein